MRRYTNKDFPLICSWAKMRGLPLPQKEDLSEIGYIVDERVAGWLYLTTSNIAMIEGVIASPHTVPSLRAQSLRKLCGVLVDTALLLGYTKIMAHTTHPSIAKVARELGFQEQPAQRLFTLKDDSDEPLDTEEGVDLTNDFGDI